MTVILGAGLSGLSAGLALTRAGRRATLIEKNARVGGLARTISFGNYHFDLGGHRFLTDNRNLQTLVSDLLGDDLLKVPRTSRICINNRYIDYPLTPLNAVFGLGFAKTGNILLDYGREKIRNLLRPKTITSLEDWVVSRFGRTMFELYFKEYSEKVWGIPCRDISKDWVARRIDGLSLAQFIRHALLRCRVQKVKTLTDSFRYPRLGIGQLADRMRDEIRVGNRVDTSTEVRKIFHAHGTITGIAFVEKGRKGSLVDSDYISSIPLTRFIEKMVPLPPEHVCQAAARIRFRSLVIVALFLNRPSITDLTWMYFPGSDIPFGRIHEPVNWSPDLAPAGKSHVIAEYFCNSDDAVWKATDEKLASLTSRHLQQLGFLAPDDIADSCVLRIPYAYPVFDIAYKKQLRIITEYLGGFTNLQLIGRSGMFSYLNMDQAMESGLAAAEKIIRQAECRSTEATPAPQGTHPQLLQASPSS